MLRHPPTHSRLHKIHPNALSLSRHAPDDTCPNITYREWRTLRARRGTRELVSVAPCPRRHQCKQTGYERRDRRRRRLATAAHLPPLVAARRHWRYLLQVIGGVKRCEILLQYGGFYSFIERRPLSYLFPAQEENGSKGRHLLVRFGVVGGVALKAGGSRGACTWCLLEAMNLRVAVCLTMHDASCLLAVLCCRP